MNYIYAHASTVFSTAAGTYTRLEQSMRDRQSNRHKDSGVNRVTVADIPLRDAARARIRRFISFVKDEEIESPCRRVRFLKKHIA